MKKKNTFTLFLFLCQILSGFVFSLSLYANEGEFTPGHSSAKEGEFAEPRLFFEIPAWETLTLERTPDIFRLKTAEGLTLVEFYALKREMTSKLDVRVEKDCLVINTGSMKTAEFGNVQLRIRGFDHRKLETNDCSLFYRVQGPVGKKGNFYFEGYTRENTHYYEAQKIHFNGTPQKLVFDKFIDPNLSWLSLRYDFFGEGEFRLYSSAIWIQPQAPSALIEGRPELIFSANFDGTAEAQTAGGQKNPKRAENLHFSDDAVSGKSIEFRDGFESVLEYLTDGNLRQESGAISVWVKPDWSGPADRNTWRTILSEPWEPQTRIGSGAIWCWIYEGRLRFDTSDMRDEFLTSNFPREDKWTHVVFCWDKFQKSLYVNGKPSRSFSDSVNMATPRRPYFTTPLPMESFFVGNLRGQQVFQGKIDELQIYSLPISHEEVQKKYREFRTLHFTKKGNQVRLEDSSDFLFGSVKNAGSESVSCTVSLRDAQKHLIGERTLIIPSGNEKEFRFEPRKMKPGLYSLDLHFGKELLDSRLILVLDAPRSLEEQKELRRKIARENASKSVWTEELDLKLIEEIDPVNISAERVAFFGKSAIGELDGKKYLEMPNEAGSRFALRLPRLENGKVYCLEWDIPDDKMRTVDIIAQSARLTAGSEYELQTGYCTGDEYPNSGKWLTVRNLLWARSDDYALVFTTARTVTPIDKNSGAPAIKECVGGGAAAANIRVFEVLNSELPIARVNPAKPVHGWTRQVGIYFEDPAINSDFGVNGALIENYPIMLDRICQYMKFSGQNLLAYPMVWYHGPIGERYNPRNHVPFFFEGILERFDREGLEFMGTFNQNNVSFDVPVLSRADLTSGKLNDSFFSIHGTTGTPHPGGWHGTPPIFNTLHPEVQAMTLRQLDDILAMAVRHPSFKGIILHLPRHALHSLGDIRAGYNRFLIEDFERETGIQIPVDHSAPLFGKLCFEWLMKNARAEWTDWRCRKIAAWYRKLAERLRKARPDLKLGINCMVPILYEPSEYDAGTERDFWEIINREMGVDAKYFADVPNIFIAQTVFPADYRWTENRKPDDIRARLRKTEETAEMYSSLKPSPNAWIHHHDRYWESAIGADESKSMTADWFKEHKWRVSTLNPVDFYAMKHYVMPLRYHDIQGITKGGFLIGTYGMEEKLAAFSAAFRALPAVPFADHDCSTEEVKVRQYSDGKFTWFYAVNTSESFTEVQIPVSAEYALDLARNVRIKVSGETLTVKLAPYSLRSFRVRE